MIEPTSRKDSPQPVFLERRGYRLRRAMDAVRLLPVLGLLLWMVPVLWPVAQDTGGDGIALSRAIGYVFWVWAGLVLVTWLLWLRTQGVDSVVSDPAQTPESEPPGEGGDAA